MPHNKVKEILIETWEWLQDFAYGFSASITLAYLWQEFVHIIAVIIGGAILTVLNHYLRKYLKKLDNESSK